MSITIINDIPEEEKKQDLKLHITKRFIATFEPEVKIKVNDAMWVYISPRIISVRALEGEPLLVKCYTDENPTLVRISTREMLN